MFFQRLWRLGTRYPVLTNLVVLTIAYLVLYYLDSNRPGGRPTQPLGWFGWADQRAYLRSAKAFLAGDLESAQHTFPILYPMLGSLMLPFTEWHPFLLPDLAGLLIVVGIYIAIARKSIGLRWAIGLFWLGLLLMPEVYKSFIIPRNNILAAVLIGILMWELHRGAGTVARSSVFTCMVFSGAAFLLLPTRPLDAVATVPLCLLFLWRLAKTGWMQPSPQRWRWFSTRIAANGAGASIGVVLLVGGNLLIHGEAFGGYTGRMAQSAFRFHNYGQKFVSLLLDSGTLYGDVTDSLLGHYPWGILVMAAVGIIVWLGTPLERAIALSGSLLFLVYVPFVMLTPDVMWELLTVRYYLPFVPYALFLVAIAVKRVRMQWDSPRARMGTLVAGILMLGVSLLGFRPVPVSAKFAQPDPLRLDIRKTGSQRIDLLDLDGMESTSRLYRVRHESMTLAAGDSTYQYLRDFRIIPYPGGARVLFYEPIEVDVAVLSLDSSISYNLEKGARSYTYGYQLGLPAWLFRRPLPR